MPRFTEAFVATITAPPGARDTLTFDTEVRGFGVRAYKDGRKCYIVKFIHKGRQRRASLGECTQGNLRSMRLLASDVKAMARAGRDILAERASEREAIKNRRTFGSLVPEYLKACAAKVRPSTLREARRYLTQSWAPLHNRDIKSISRSDVLTVVENLALDSGARSADCGKAALSGFFVWAMNHKDRYADANPSNGIEKRATGHSRERTLSDGELREVWHACRDDDHGRITRLLLLTGARRAEIGDLVWDELDVAGRQIRLPRERCKNDKAHTIPLSDQALALLPERRDGHDHLFGARVGGGYSGWSKGKRLLDERIADARRKAGSKKALPSWTLHDLRRTCATGLQRIGTRLEVIESALNHTSGSRGGIVGVYQLYDFMAERKAALERWAKHVAEIVA